MAFDLNAYKSSGLIDEGARPSLFEVQFVPPASIGGSTEATKFTFTCQAASLPPMSVDVIELPYFGRKIKVAGERTYPDWQVTVQNDEDFMVRAMFEAWNNSLNRIISNVRSKEFDQSKYKAEFTVSQYAKIGGDPIRTYQMAGVWPTQIGAIELAWENTNQIERFDVTLAYDWWVPGIEKSSISYVDHVSDVNS